MADGENDDDLRNVATYLRPPACLHPLASSFHCPSFCGCEEGDQIFHQPDKD